ncbi:hypothetical protein SD37_04445 [Amycolatopsis orientalis]|uniref:Uncharacterized protein n=1 Tax=Amycolatopsis orientalis TaxID=31958 RepID=A0A193BS25_AMYOR|nr:hypothetical protein [Amycolatopsis orientalis]ANN14979.1 hypothetical protein SD37_04445 [Amycolatopsis orientalis]
MKRWVLVLVVGIGFLMVTLLFSQENPNLIKCGGRIMSPGDVCETTKNGRKTGEDTYDEMKAAATSRAETFRDHGLWMAGVGVALTGLGATMVIRAKRRKARAGVTAPQGGQQQWQGQPQPGFPAQQGNQQPYAHQAVQQFPPRQPAPPAQAVQQYPQQYPPTQGGWPQQPPQQPGPPQQSAPPQQFGPTGH